MRPITNFMIAGTLGLVALAGRSEAAQPTWTIGNAAQDDLGLGTAVGLQGAFGSMVFSNSGNKFSNDPDGGCDGDAFANFGGKDASGLSNKTCGDVLMMQGDTTGQTVDPGNSHVLTNLTTLTTTNHTGLEFHVEDSAGPVTGTAVTGHLVESLTVSGVGTANFSIPYSITFGSSGDMLTIPGFDIGVDGVVVISPGSATLGSTGSDDDDWAFETTLFGCVSSRDPGSDSCGTTPTNTVIPFKADDPPPPDDVPEPASLAILGSALAALRLARRRRA